MPVKYDKDFKISVLCTSLESFGSDMIFYLYRLYLTNIKSRIIQQRRQKKQRLQPSLQLTLLIKIPIMILQPNPLQEVWTRPLGSNKVSYILITWRQSWHLVKWLFFNNVCNSKALVDLSFHLLRHRLVSFLFKCKVICTSQVLNTV